jgi:hypothetical protein
VLCVSLVSRARNVDLLGSLLKIVNGKFANFCNFFRRSTLIATNPPKTNQTDHLYPNHPKGTAEDANAKGFS